MVRSCFACASGPARSSEAFWSGDALSGVFGHAGRLPGAGQGPFLMKTCGGASPFGRVRDESRGPVRRKGSCRVQNAGEVQHGYGTDNCGTCCGCGSGIHAAQVSWCTQGWRLQLWLQLQQCVQGQEAGVKLKETAKEGGTKVPPSSFSGCMPLSVASTGEARKVSRPVSGTSVPTKRSCVLRFLAG